MGFQTARAQLIRIQITNPTQQAILPRILHFQLTPIILLPQHNIQQIRIIHSIQVKPSYCRLHKLVLITHNILQRLELSILIIQLKLIPLILTILLRTTLNIRPLQVPDILNIPHKQTLFTHNIQLRPIIKRSIPRKLVLCIQYILNIQQTLTHSIHHSLILKGLGRQLSILHRVELHTPNIQPNHIHHIRPIQHQPKLNTHSIQPRLIPLTRITQLEPTLNIPNIQPRLVLLTHSFQPRLVPHIPIILLQHIPNIPSILAIQSPNHLGQLQEDTPLILLQQAHHTLLILPNGQLVLNIQIILIPTILHILDIQLALLMFLGLLFISLKHLDAEWYSTPRSQSMLKLPLWVKYTQEDLCLLQHGLPQQLTQFLLLQYTKVPLVITHSNLMIHNRDQVKSLLIMDNLETCPL